MTSVFTIESLSLVDRPKDITEFGITGGVDIEFDEISHLTGLRKIKQPCIITQSKLARLKSYMPHLESVEFMCISENTKLNILDTISSVAGSYLSFSTGYIHMIFNTSHVTISYMRGAHTELHVTSSFTRMYETSYIYNCIRAILNCNPSRICLHVNKTPGPDKMDGMYTCIGSIVYKCAKIGLLVTCDITTSNKTDKAKEEVIIRETKDPSVIRDSKKVKDTSVIRDSKKVADDTRRSRDGRRDTRKSRDDRPDNIVNLDNTIVYFD